ncbi:hypothetical protein HF1_13800 [Mycoplasma haemofelis str. Langford 1]|uniref:Uncharacterized protein n=1 Tax=Mycoplasma haemofelis (strain Langford 1) TaxID=941640 RepID=E8ZJR7_MYCHL|nr:hypothetical protein [Mycoplasma haemofelis]CBY93388.1 hypothetical protein HF1_13800 [Mycoplasma haemofelis str. Langford 1]
MSLGVRGVKAVLSSAGLISGGGGIVALTTLNKTPVAELELVEEELPLPVIEKQEEIIETKELPPVDVYVVRWQGFDQQKRPLVKEVSQKELSEAFISEDEHAKRCKLKRNSQNRSYVYWHTQQKQLVCEDQIQWQDWLTSGVKKSPDLEESKLSEEMGKAKKLKDAMLIYLKIDDDWDQQVFEAACKEMYSGNFQDDHGLSFCKSLLWYADQKQ